MNEKGLENLANAVVLQAVDDYRKIICGILPTGTTHCTTEEQKQMALEREKRNCIKFFNSPFVSMILQISGADVMRALDNERFSVIDRTTGEILQSNKRYYETKLALPKYRRKKVDFIIINDETGNEVYLFYDGQTIRTTDEIKVADA